MIWLFIKFFSEESHADAFIRGDLFMNTIDHFRGLEAQEDGRGDSTEATWMWLQPKDTVIKLNFGGQEIVITEADLAAPTSFSYAHHDDLHLFCMYAVRTQTLKFVNGKAHVSSDDMEKYRSELKVDSRCLEFGKYAVVVPAVQFMDQVKESLRSQKYNLNANLVKYYDDKVFHGEIPQNEVPFSKQERFSYQHEFRLCVNTKSGMNSAITINIGDLSQISAKLDSKKIIDGCLFRVDEGFP